jgi:hypothetical protein
MRNLVSASIKVGPSELGPGGVWVRLEVRFAHQGDFGWVAIAGLLENIGNDLIFLGPLFYTS